VLAALDTVSTYWVASQGFDPHIYEVGMAARYFLSQNLFTLWVSIQPVVFLFAGLMTLKAKRMMINRSSGSRRVSELETGAIAMTILFIASIPIVTILNNFTFPLRFGNELLFLVFPAVGFAATLAVLAYFTMDSFKMALRRDPDSHR
ncbi:MAG: hypothetical protein ACE5PO_09350, partial [Candidatus Bathyarchaeia archaeon]